MSLKSKELIEIESILFNKESASAINKGSIDCFKRVEEIEVQGALMVLLSEPVYFNRIMPGLTFDDYYPFNFLYFEKCMRGSHRGNWGHSPYEAAYDLTDFIKATWNDDKLVEKVRIFFHKDIKKRFEKMCKNADRDLKFVLINDVFEHLFENKEIRSYFRDWKNNVLYENYFKCAVDKSREIE